MTFKTTLDSETVHHTENGLTFCGRMTLEVELDIFETTSYFDKIKTVYIEIEGKPHDYMALNEHDQLQVAQWLSDRRSEFESYKMDMRIIATEIAAERSCDDIEGGVA